MEKPILLVGGGKGGVGKSLLSIALVDYVSVTDGRPFLVETDTSVPDVYKTYGGEIGADQVNLDEREGWIELLNLVESHPEDTIVVNTGARNQTGSAISGGRCGRHCPISSVG
jgi:MinD-like ATPase involved in chromosome partitioning or flagellar assembly